MKRPPTGNDRIKALYPMVLMAFFGMMFFMMGAYGVFDIGQAALQQGVHSFVGFSFTSTVQLNARISKRALSSAANASADQYVGLLLTQKDSEPFMAVSIRADHLSGFHSAILHVIEFELLRPAKVLEDQAVIIRHRDSHSVLLLFHNLPDGFVFHLLAVLALTDLRVPIQRERSLAHFLKG
jgi:hypothetical protein